MPVESPELQTGCMGGGPSLAALVHNMPQHLLQGLVKPFHQPICLGVMHTGVELLHLQLPGRVGHEFGDTVYLGR